MIQMDLSQAAGVLDCEVTEPGVVFTGITTDSRQVKPGMLFAALAGETFDGQDYIGQAVAGGAAGAIGLSALVDEREKQRNRAQ